MSDIPERIGCAVIFGSAAIVAGIFVDSGQPFVAGVAVFLFGLGIMIASWVPTGTERHAHRKYLAESAQSG